ncbi:MAG: sigma 54-interacting transcriptional regulator [Pseudomonadota bacterium]|jgi:two-component system response regulator FlrC|nr:sigma 54-interacting transcriptional regulator [Pseudomonadota bacterium]
MCQITIIATGLNVGDTLKDLLARRRVSALVTEDLPTEKSAVLVCSAKHEASVGHKAVLDTARRIGAQSVMIIEEGANAPLFTQEMGGRLTRFALTDGGAAPLRNGWLLTLVDVMAAPFCGMVAGDRATGKLMDMAARVAKTDVTVFVNGPTGSGKEVLGKLIHAYSPRKSAPFIAINCAAIPENMLEAILFGHEKGAFTGASTPNKGIVRAAQGGTLMLDEISEMPMGLQAKLLRVLQEKTVTPLGSQKEEKVDIRVIATSNRNMMAEVRAGKFREDLFYRLNVFPLSTVALNDRKDDLPALAVAMIRRHTPESTALPILSDSAIQTLMDHDWPGNVRELENIIQRALVLHEDGIITSDDIMITATDGLCAVAGDVDLAETAVHAA